MIVITYNTAKKIFWLDSKIRKIMGKNEIGSGTFIGNEPIRDLEFVGNIKKLTEKQKIALEKLDKSVKFYNE